MTKIMTKTEMIQELINKYQYPVNKNRSTTFIRAALHRMRERTKMYQKILGKK